ncbi:MAG: hypothetical protein GWO07_07145 [Candidatus Dadabacteria bacterium]|nr:hypothetical protein [Candidatus Dadabacteria bacterium]NIS08525.1 hypothetical protein [Candidatus Dadabacteria bacterium]NIY21992.1 hypothetical protein [Candidatus Dadabacteria bacterium]
MKLIRAEQDKRSKNNYVLFLVKKNQWDNFLFLNEKKQKSAATFSALKIINIS